MALVRLLLLRSPGLVDADTPLDGRALSSIETEALHPTGFDASPDGRTWIIQSLRTASAMTRAKLSLEGLDPEPAPKVKLDWPDYLQPSTRHDWSGRFSPDGQRIAFASDRSGFSELWMMNALTKDIEQITDLKATEIGGLEERTTALRAAF